MKLATRAKIGVIVVGAAVAALAMPTAWWQMAGRDEKPHQRLVTFDSSWSVYSHDRKSKLRSDSATVTWSTGDERHSHSDVHHGGKFHDQVLLGPGHYLIAFRTQVDTATDTKCRMHIGNVAFPSTREPEYSSTGVCSLSTVLIVK